MLTVKEELKEAAELRLPRDTKKAEIQQRVDDMIRILGLEKIKDSKNMNIHIRYSKLDRILKEFNNNEKSSSDIC